MVSNLTVKVGADIDGLQKELKKATAHLGAFGKGMDGISSQLKTMVAGFGMIEVGRQVIQTTSEFQKFAAVLKNTLGSDSAAQRSLQQIKDFAASTPFSVQELTGSFVKLANQGFVPTSKEMRKLGDLAASTGKSFDMLTEAVIDAQVGEFERLKEFGIRAEKQGDKVTFAFKGVKKQVDFTSDSIQQYILSIGDAEGVSGSMAAISETLGGRISNLGDAWDGLMVAMGESSSGPLFGTITALTNIVKALTDFRSEMALIGQAISPFHDLADVSKETLDYLLKTSDVEMVIAPLNNQDFQQFYTDFQKNAETFREAFLKQGESIEDINILWDHYVKKRVEAANGDRIAAEAAKKAADEAKRAADEATRLAAAQFEAAKSRLLKGSGALRTEVGTKEDASGNFLLDLGVFADQAQRYAAIGERIIATNNAIKVSTENTLPTNDWAQVWVDWADVAASGISQLAASLGEASVGVGNFGDDILKMVGSFATQLGEALIAAGTSVLIAKSSLLMNPAMAIAAGAVLVAAGAALNASVQKSVDSLGSSAGSSHRSAAGTGSRSNTGSLGNGGFEIQLGGEFRIQGPDLVYIFNRQQQLNNRTKG
jgi:hypothetical protein